MPLPQYKSAIHGRTPQPARAGVSLMEVLIAVFVVSIGLLGIAALIPVANFALIETSKADRSAACGQAAMRDVRVRRLIELVPTGTNQNALIAGHTIVVDPLYFAKAPGPQVDTFGAALRRSPLYTQARLQNPTVSAYMTADEISRVFHWHDDLLFDMQEGTTLRPRGFAAHGNAPMPEQSYSWFFTVSPAAAEDQAASDLGWEGRKRFTVSVAVCYQREFDVPVQSAGISGVLGPRVGGNLRGVISGIQTTNAVDLEPGQWVLLVGERPVQAIGGSTANVAEWYRIAAGSDNFYAVDGPYWPSTSAPNEMIIVPGVLGVYTTSVEIDRGSEWSR